MSKQKATKSGAGKCGPFRKWVNDAAVLVSSPTLRRITLVMFGNFFFTGFTYWGISLAGNTFRSQMKR